MTTWKFPENTMSNSNDVYRDLLNAQRYEELDALTDQALKGNPHDFLALHFRAESHKMQMRYASALSCALKVLQIAPKYLSVSPVVVHCAGQLGLDDLAVRIVDGLEFANTSTQQSGKAIFYRDLARYEDALKAIDEVAAAFPDDPYPKYIKGTIELGMGRVETGTIHYQSYVSREFFHIYRPELEAMGWDLQRYWCGEDLTGKIVQIVPHGGIGDMIQFIRYARCLKELGAKNIIVSLPSTRIAKLLASCTDVQVGVNISEDQYDVFTDPYGLWLNLHPRFGYLSTEKYLAAPDSSFSLEMVKHIKERAGGRRLLGLSWCSDMSDGVSRTVPLAQLLPLFALPGIHWVIFQRGWALKEFEKSPMAAQCTVVPESATFDDTAAIVQQIDGVVTIESFMTHLAGSVGKPVFFMASRALDWRHGNAQSRSPWYPQTYIARQPVLGDWHSVVKEIIRLLGEVIHPTVAPRQTDTGREPSLHPGRVGMNSLVRNRRTLFVDCTGLDSTQQSDEAVYAIEQLIRYWAHLATGAMDIRLVRSGAPGVPFGVDEGLHQRLLGRGVEGHGGGYRAPVEADVWLITGSNPTGVIEYKSAYESMKLQGVRVMALIHDLTPVFTSEPFASSQVGAYHIYARFLMGLNGALCFSQKIAKDITGLAAMNGIAMEPNYQVSWVYPGVVTSSGSDRRGSVNPAVQPPCFVTWTDLGEACGLEHILDAFEVLWAQNEELHLCIGSPKLVVHSALAQRIDNHAERGGRLQWLENSHYAHWFESIDRAHCYIDNRMDGGYSLALMQAKAQGLQLLLRDTPMLRELGGGAATFFETPQSQSIQTSVRAALDKLNDPLISNFQGGKTSVQAWDVVARYFWNAIDQME